MASRQNRFPRLSLAKALILLLAMAGAEKIIEQLSAFPFALSPELQSAVQMLALAVSLGIIFWLFIQYTVELWITSNRLFYSLGHLLLAKLGIQSRRAPERYIESLFDEYAPTFDQHLVQKLNYRVPEQLASFLKDNNYLRPGMHLLDLGCGTGLCALHFAPFSETLVGVDISAKMLKEAEKLGRYTRLIHGSISRASEHFNRHFDLAIAADVLVYTGDLEPVLASTHLALKHHGVFAFTVEAHQNADWHLTNSGRYAHSLNYITRVASACGFRLIKTQQVNQRTENDMPVEGFMVLLEKL